MASRTRTLISLAWPIVLARAAQAVIGFTDALMTGPLGERALAAATSGALNSFMLWMLPVGTVLIVQSFAAQLKGRGELGAARRYAWYGLVIAAAAGLLALASMPGIDAALGWFQFEPEVRHLMASYVVIRLTSVAAVVGTEALGNWYGGLGNTRMHMIAGAVSMVTNVFLNWVLIYGHLGAPALGVDGAALASSLSSWVGFAVLLVPFLRGWAGAPPRSGTLRLSAGELWRVVRFGVPNGVNWLLEFSAFLLFMNTIVPRLGTVSLAAMNVVLQVNTVSFMPAFGLASAGAILVGQAVGRDARDEVWPILRTTIWVAAGWMAAIGVSYVLLPREIVGWFARPGEEGAALRQVGATMLALSAVWQLFDGTAMSLSESLRAAGDTAWSMWARVVLAWFVFLPVASLTVIRWGGGPVGAMLCLAGYLALLALALWWRFRSGAWRRIELIGEVPPG